MNIPDNIGEYWAGRVVMFEDITVSPKRQRLGHITGFTEEHSKFWIVVAVGYESERYAVLPEDITLL